MNPTRTRKNKRNFMAFEAPVKLSEETKRIAERKMVSTSVICRHALNNYILADNSEDIGMLRMNVKKI